MGTTRRYDFTRWKFFYLIMVIIVLNKENSVPANENYSRAVIYGLDTIIRQLVKLAI